MILEDKEKEFTLNKAVVILLAFVFAPGVTGMIFRFCCSTLFGTATDAFSTMLGYIIGSWLTVFLIRTYMYKTAGPLAKAVNFKPQEIKTQTFLLTAALGIGANLLLSSVFTLMQPLFPTLFGNYDEASSSVISSGCVVLNVIWTVAMAPVVEEIVFRGYLLNTLKRCLGTVAGAVVTSIIFGLVHGTALWMLYAMLMGLVLAWLAVRLDNLAYSAAFHIGFNLTALPSALIPPDSHTYEILYGSKINIVIIGVLGALISWATYSKIQNQIKNER